MNSGIGDDDEMGCAVEARAQPTLFMTVRREIVEAPHEESDEAVEGARRAGSPKEEGREEKKWGGDGYITSPISSTPRESPQREESSA